MRYSFSPIRLSLVPILIVVAALLAVALAGAYTNRTGLGPQIPTIQQGGVPGADHQRPLAPEAPAQPALPTTIEPPTGSPSATDPAPAQTLTPAPATSSGSNTTAPAPMVAPSRWSEPVEGGAPTLEPPQTNPKGPPPGGMGQ